jgi:hypothetical protein
MTHAAVDNGGTDISAPKHSDQVAWTDRQLWRPLARIAVALGGVVTAAAACVTHLVLTRFLVSVHYNDFGRFYYSAWNAARGLPMYGPTPATPSEIAPGVQVELLNMNPPHFQALIWPLTLLPVSSAYGVWVAVNLVAAVWAIAQVSSTLATKPSLKWILIGLVAAPTLATTVTGQLTGLLMALATWMWLDIRAGRWTRAAIAIGIGWSVKLFLVPLVLYLVAKRQWRAAAVSLACGLGCFAAGIVVYGVGPHVEWLRALRSASWAWEPMNASMFAPFARLSAQADLANGRVPLVVPSGVLAGLCALIVLTAGMIAAARDDRSDRSVLTVLLTCVLASPLGWVYYFWMFAGPLWASWDDRIVRRVVMLTAPGWLAPFFLLWRFESAASALTFGSAYTWALLLIWIGALASTFRERFDRRHGFGKHAVA